MELRGSLGGELALRVRGLTHSALAIGVCCLELVCFARSPQNLLSTERRFVRPALSLRSSNWDPHSGFGVLARKLSHDRRKSPSSTNPGS